MNQQQVTNQIKQKQRTKEDKKRTEEKNKQV